MHRKTYKNAIPEIPSTTSVETVCSGWQKKALPEVWESLQGLSNVSASSALFPECQSLHPERDRDLSITTKTSWDYLGYFLGKYFMTEGELNPFAVFYSDHRYWMRAKN